MSVIKLIIGIGNPDEKYQNTRHNVGFMFVDYLTRQSFASQNLGGLNKKLEANDFEFDKKLNAFTSKIKLEKTLVILAKPQVYVNKSGEAVKKLIKTYNLQPTTYNNLIIIHDDLDIPFGNTKISFDKNSGGHKGIESVMKNLKTKKFYRLRIGLATKPLQKARQQSDKKSVGYGFLRHLV